MHVCIAPQPLSPCVAHTLVPPFAVQAPRGLHTMTVDGMGILVLAQQTSPFEQSSALRQQPEIAAQLPSALHVGIEEVS